MNKKNRDLLDKLYQRIEWAYDKGKKELLEREALLAVEFDLTEGLAEVMKDVRDEDIILRYKKTKSGWRNEMRSGFQNLNSAETRLEKWKQLIEEVYKQEKLSRPLKSEIFIPSNSKYSARVVLRGIFSEAKAEIAIQDNYMSHELLEILEPYLKNGTVKGRLLTNSEKNQNLKALLSDLDAFVEQCPNAKVEIASNNKSHGRFIFIDTKQVYHSGHTLHDLGEKADSITKYNDQSEAKKALLNFEEWWTNSESLK